MNRTGFRQVAGSVSATVLSMSSRSRNRPGSAGTSFSLSSALHAGWVKSPVATTPIPLRAAQWARCSRSRSRLVAREYFEWMCRSAWKRMGYHASAVALAFEESGHASKARFQLRESQAVDDVAQASQEYRSRAHTRSARPYDGIDKGGLTGLHSCDG